MINNRFLIIVLAVCWLPGVCVTVCAQDSTACRVAIQKVFKIMQNTEELMRTGVFMDYKTQMCLSKEFGSKCGEDSAQLIMKGKKYALISRQKTIFHDDSIQVVILDERKQIIITVMRVLNKEKIPQLNLIGIQDSLLFTSHYTDCKFEMTGQDSCYSATLELSKNVQKQAGVKKVHYLVDKTRGVIRKAEIYYTEGKQFASATFDIKQVDYKYAREPFDGNALQHIFDDRGQLLKAYESYELKDLRNKGAYYNLPKQNKANTKTNK